MNKKNWYEKKYKYGEEIPRSNKIYALNLVSNNTKLNILDIGCGTGMNTSILLEKGHTVTGIDISEEAITKYNEKGFSGICMNIESGLKFESEMFDLVFCSEVIEHIVEYEYLVARHEPSS